MNLIEYFDFLGPGIFIGLTATVYLLALFNILRIIKQDLSPGAALSWILVNAAFPLLGVPLYYFLGQSKITGYVKRSSRSQKALEYGGNPLIETSITSSDDIPESGEATVIALSTLDEAYRVFPGYSEIMINGEQAFPEIFKCIGRAREYILVQYYILRHDRLGLELKDLLKSKAAQGLRVYLLIDDWGSFGLGRKYVKDLKRAGVRVTRFLPFGLRFNFQVNFRNHRKLVIIDGSIAFTGGLNMGLEYLGRKLKGDWRDTHLKLCGPCLGPLITTFMEDWYFASKQDLRDEIDFKPPQKSADHTLAIQVVSFGPGDNHISAGLTLFAQAIMGAKKSLWIATPYLIPDTILENALILASLRGVKIKILIPRIGDSKIVHMVSLVHAEKLQEYMEIYLYTEGFMHQKVMLVDDQTSIIGTSNFDNRSIYLNFETSVAIHDKGFAQKIRAMLLEDFTKSRSLGEGNPLKVYTKPFYRFIRLLGPLF